VNGEAKASSDVAMVRRVWPFLKPDLWFYAAAILAAPLSAALTVAQPFLLKKVIDDAIVPGLPQNLMRLSLLYLAAVVVSFVLESGYTLALGVGATRTISRLRTGVFAHALSLGQSFFDREPTGRLLTRVTSDVEALGETLTAGAVTLLLDALLVLGLLGLLFGLDHELTFVVLTVAPPLAIAVELIRRRMRTVFVTVRTALAELMAYASERFAGIEVVQLYSDEARSLAGFEQRLGRYRRATVVSNVWDSLMFAIVDGVGSITAALILWWVSGGFGDLATAGLVAAFIDSVGRLFTPIRELSGKLAILQRAAGALEKIVGLLEIDEQVSPGRRTLPPETGDIVLRDVRFAYRGGPDVLHGVDLTIHDGDVVALVGRTGSGKTTIGKLLIRAYDGYRGSITLDGVELGEVKLDALRHRVGIVQQDVVLFPGTVRDNLALGGGVSDDELLEAVELAQATQLVRRLGGLDGAVAAGGRNLSVGEAQLLAFARTLAHDAPFVVLDEATASVDSLTEARIQEATRALFERKTVLVVAHRLSTITGADRICVLDAGRVVEEGPHEELLSRGGLYARLFNAQLSEERRERAAHAR